jgi:hypothetical protein
LVGALLDLDREPENLGKQYHRQDGQVSMAVDDVVHFKPVASSQELEVSS